MNKISKKNGYIVVAMLTLMLLLACSKSSSTTSAPKNPFIGGSRALTMEFEKDSPPPEVTDLGFPFKVVLTVRNDGEASIKNDDVLIGLTGFLPQDFGVTYEDIKEDKRVSEDLLSKVRDPEGKIIDGTTAFVTFPKDDFRGGAGRSFAARDVLGNTPYTVKASMCYLYNTRAIGRFCVLKNLLDTRPENQICNPNSGRPIYSSSGPVQVTNFRQYPVSQSQITFSFDVIHSGIGDLYAPTTTLRCPRDDSVLRRSLQDIVNVYVDFEGSVGLETRSRTGATARSGLLTNLNCNLEQKNAGPIRLVRGSRTVTCNVDLPPSERRTDFETNVNIFIEYFYDQSISTQVLVKNLG